VRHCRTLALVIPAVLTMAACGDDFGIVDWTAVPDTTLIYSASRADLLRMPAAFDFINLVRVEIESEGAGGNWDVALIEQDGAFHLAPEAFVTGSDSRAAIATSDVTQLEDVREAPSDTARFTRSAVPIRIGDVYVVRSRRGTCFTFNVGVRYAKLKALEVDPEAGTFRFEVVRNPNCNNRALIPSED